LEREDLLWSKTAVEAPLSGVPAAVGGFAGGIHSTPLKRGSGQDACHYSQNKEPPPTEGDG